MQSLDFYNDFVKVAGVEGVSKDAVKQAAKKNQNVLQKVIAALAEIFAPLIPAIITGGLILGFETVLTAFTSLRMERKLYVISVSSGPEWTVSCG